MHLWKRGILFFLSSLIFISCNSTTKENEITEKSTDWSLQIVQHFIEKEKIEEEVMDSLIFQLNKSQDSLIGYSKNNPIDVGKWMICSSDENNFSQIKKALKRDVDLEFHETTLLNLWRIQNKQGKLLKEISISPHPTEGFVLLMRERGQE